MNDPRFNLMNRLPGLNRRRAGHAAKALPICLRGIATMRICHRERLVFHGLILPDQRMAGHARAAKLL